MYHYVYLLTFPDAMKYIGVHSTTIEPHLDTCYLGSGKHLPSDRTPQSCCKTILEVFTSREEAVEYEVNLITVTNAVMTPNYYNARLRTFDRHGSKLTDAQREVISRNSKGFSRVAWGKKYSGDGRTPAQRAGTLSMITKNTGVKNPAKGSPGISNQGFVPWYYITPEGEYVEVHDKTKQEYASILGFTPRQLGHGFHHTNEHRRSDRLPRKGWTFGNLPRPSDLVED